MSAVVPGASAVRRAVVTAAGLVLVLAACRPCPTPSASQVTGDGTCLYSGHLIDRLEAFADTIGRSIDCAVVFNNAAPTWAELEMPWFVRHGDPNRNWATWKRADPQRRLIISQAIAPDQVPDDWRERGAAGEYDDHARTLAANLVAAGLGDSVMRLSHEANGLWTKDGLGPDPQRYESWRQAWRRFAQAMESVPGAQFTFDWTINPGVRPIAFDTYYPGDDVVDYIGVDIYDYWEEFRFGPAPDDLQTRWDVRFAEPAGVGELIAFAKAHRKPLTIPEWGLVAVGNKGGLGDNPSFVDNVVRLVRANRVAYQAYFEKSESLLLMNAPQSLQAYRDAFVGGRAYGTPLAKACRFQAPGADDP